ncbi:MAG: acyltransferase family protein [Rubrivivax sp.]|nr:acyltransferase family protein [Rubrivivax sp.]
MHPATPPANSRMTELDWLRVAAFGLLILFHVGMFYVPWDWHVKSPQPVPALQPWMQLSSPWRLCLLFVVSGAALGVALQGGSAAAGARARSKRLLLPLLLGVAVIVPPQAYLEVVEKLGYGGSYPDFLARYFAADQSFCRGSDCLVLPTWNHLWFVAYLWVYTMLVLALCRLRGTAWLAHPGWQWLTAGGRLLWLPCLLLALVRQQLVLPFPSTHNLVWDWFNHGLYGSVFVLGLALWGHADDRHGAWATALRLRWWALGGAVLALLGMPRLLDSLGGWDSLPAWGQSAWLALGATRHWLPVLAALGFARKHLRQRDGPWRRTLADAIFPFYIVHQTVIVVAGHHLARQGLPQALEATLLALLTSAVCALTYLAVRRVAWLRPWFGLPPERAA